MRTVAHWLSLIAAGAWTGAMAFHTYGAWTGWFFAAVFGIPFLYGLAHTTAKP